MKPTEFGKYTLLERVSHGGMAEVFRARTSGAAGFERIVAIKVLLPGVASDDDFITMLIDEAKIAGQLSHSNIAQIFDLGQFGGRYYIVQEYVAGRDLRTILATLARTDRGLTVAQACHMMLKVCEGLDYAHSKRDAQGGPLNLVHRDISPQNVIVSYEGEVKLIDFGIAKAEGRATQTLAGLVKGKFAYMSPEQLRGLPVDRRSDVFACGILLHELLSGRPLFKRDSDFETLQRARNAVIEPPSQHNPAIPPALDRVVLKALTRHVDDRYQTALALRDDLWEFVQTTDHHYGRSELGAWMRATFEAAPPAARASTASSTGHSEASATLPSALRARQRPSDDFGADDDPDASSTTVDPELVGRITADAHDAGLAEVAEVADDLAAPTYRRSVAPRQDPALVGSGPSRLEFRAPSRQPPVASGAGVLGAEAGLRAAAPRARASSALPLAAPVARPAPRPSAAPLTRPPPAMEPRASGVAPLQSFEAPPRFDLAAHPLELLRPSGALRPLAARPNPLPASHRGRVILVSAVALLVLALTTSVILALTSDRPPPTAAP